LRRSLPFSQHNFRHSSAQRAVVIDLGESEIFEGKMAQARDRVVGRDFAFADSVEELADGFGVQERSRLALE
jgi:hypothetical protein